MRLNFIAFTDHEWEVLMMTTFPNFHDFYQRNLIPIGKKDLNFIQTNKHDKNSSYWLIALEGQCAEQVSTPYHWNISIYLADTEGSFLFQQPYFRSSSYNCFHAAFDQAKEYESFGKNDLLTTTIHSNNM